MKRKIAAFSVAAMIGSVGYLGCPHTEVTPMPPTVTDQNLCPAACANLQKLGCDEGKPIDMKRACLKDGDCDTNQSCSAGTCTASCEAFCRSTENEGVWLDPGCVSRITSCKQIDSCPVPVKKD